MPRTIRTPKLDRFGDDLPAARIERRSQGVRPGDERARPHEEPDLGRDFAGWLERLRLHQATTSGELDPHATLRGQLVAEEHHEDLREVVVVPVDHAIGQDLAARRTPEPDRGELLGPRQRDEAGLAQQLFGPRARRDEPGDREEDTAYDHEVEYKSPVQVLGIIPARGGSKRLPRKNLRPLAGKPLVLWAVEAAAGAKQLARVIVTSDDREVLDLVESDGRALAVNRPAELATDTSPAIDYVRHALTLLEDDDTRYDAVAIVQPSSPLTEPSDIDGTIALLQETGAETAVSVVRVGHDLHPAKLKRMDGSCLLPYYEDERGRMAAHELPDVFVRNCSVYVSRRDVVERGVIIGASCHGYEMPRSRSVDINDELDFAFAEFLCARGMRT